MIKKRFNKLTAWLLTLAMLTTFISGLSLTSAASNDGCGNHGDSWLQLSWNAEEKRIYYTGMDTMPSGTKCVAHIYKNLEQDNSKAYASEELKSYDSYLEPDTTYHMFYTVSILAAFPDGCVATVSDPLTVEIIPDVLPVITYIDDTTVEIRNVYNIPSDDSYTLYIYNVDEDNVEHEVFSTPVTYNMDGIFLSVNIYMYEPMLYRIVIKNRGSILSNVIEIDKRPGEDAYIKDIVCGEGENAGQFTWSEFEHPEIEKIGYIVNVFKNGNQFYQHTTRTTSIDLITLMSEPPKLSNGIYVPPEGGELPESGSTYTVSVQAVEITSESTNGLGMTTGDILTVETTTDESFVYTDLDIKPGTLKTHSYASGTLLEAVEFTGYIKDRVKHVNSGLGNTVTFKLIKGDTEKEVDGTAPLSEAAGYDSIKLSGFKFYELFSIPVLGDAQVEIELIEDYDVYISDTENGKATVPRADFIQGDTVPVTLTPDAGYIPETMTVTYVDADGVTQNVTVTDNSFIMPAFAVTVTATFKACDHTGDANSVTNGIYECCGGYEPATDSDNDGYYEISNAGQLFWFAEYVANVNNEVNAKLVSDITIPDEMEWTPIDNLYGNFDGNCKTISGLAVNDSEGDYVGFLGYIGHWANVYNLHITNSSFLDTDAIYTGAIAGYHGGGEIVNCYIDETVSIAGTTFGGLVGYELGKMKNCYAQSKLAGNGSHGSFENCFYIGQEDELAGTTPVTAQQLESGEIAYLLQSGILGETIYDDEGNEIGTAEPEHIWGQTIGIDKYPVMGGQKVLYENSTYYNDFAILQNGAEGAKAVASLFIPTAGTYTLIFADYEGTRLNSIDTVAFTADSDKAVVIIPSKIDITLSKGDKIMLWQDMTSLVPICEAYVVK